MNAHSQVIGQTLRNAPPNNQQSKAIARHDISLGSLGESLPFVMLHVT